MQGQRNSEKEDKKGKYIEALTSETGGETQKKTYIQLMLTWTKETRPFECKDIIMNES